MRIQEANGNWLEDERDVAEEVQFYQDQFKRERDPSNYSLLVYPRDGG